MNDLPDSAYLVVGIVVVLFVAWLFIGRRRWP